MLNFRQQAKAFDGFLINEVQTLFLKGAPHNLYEPCNYTLALGGKRIRPTVCLMASELFQDSVTKDSYWAAAAVELFHNFTLVHDDIMDQAPIRRGRPTVYKQFSNTAAILSGDVLNIIAYQSLQQVRSELLYPLLQLFNQTAIEVCEGQQLDMDFEQCTQISEAEYIEMIRLKTAVLLAASLKMGALCAGASPKDSELIYEFGIQLGIAFQIQDDYLDTFGTEESLGKQIGGDIQSNKKTILAIFAQENADDFQKAALESYITLPSIEKFEHTQSMFKELKVDEYCKEKISEYTLKALKALESINIEQNRKTELIALVDYLMHRSS